MEKKYIVIWILGFIVCLLSAVYLYQIMNPPVIGDWSKALHYQFNVASMTFTGASANAPNYINMTIQNTGSSSFTLTDKAQVSYDTGVTVNNKTQVKSLTGLTVTSTGNKGYLNCTGGKSIKISITMSAANPATGGWVSGTHYSIVLLMTEGTKITTVAMAP